MSRSRPPTTEQIDAISHRGSACVLSSGAGCGKTTVLTARYLALLTDDRLAVPQIVAITFTERAAREMRKRIREEVTKRLDAAADDGERERWRTHKRHLESAPIQTIHAFCTALLRRYATDAGLDPDVSVLDDAAAAALRNAAARTALETLLTSDGVAGEDLRELVVLFGWPATLAVVASARAGRHKIRYRLRIKNGERG